MSSIKATFDGNAFVPQQPINLPTGTEVDVVVRTPRQPTEEENRKWQEILAEIASTTPEYVTADEAIRQTRGRP